MFGTLYKPGDFRLAVKVIDQDGEMLICQTLSVLNKIVAPEEYFIPRGEYGGMMLLEQQIAEYESLDEDFKKEQFLTVSEFSEWQVS